MNQSQSSNQETDNDFLITEKRYPITALWIFKSPILIFIVSIIAFVFGLWFPYLVIAFPILLIANPLMRANFHFALEPKHFMVRQGVLSKKQRIFPYGVIQSVFVKQDLFDRIFGLASLAVENASYGGGFSLFGKKVRQAQNRQTQPYGQDALGTIGNKVSIPGLKKHHAQEPREMILKKMRENPIDDKRSGL